MHIPSHKQAIVKQAVVDSVTCGQAVYSAVHIRQYKCSWDFALGQKKKLTIELSHSIGVVYRLGVVTSRAILFFLLKFNFSALSSWKYLSNFLSVLTPDHFLLYCQIYYFHDKIQPHLETKL